MPTLQKLTLEYDEKKGRWALENDKTNKTLRTFATKADATKGGALKRALGPEGGSVKIQNKNGKYQEERTYPRRADPRQSRG